MADKERYINGVSSLSILQSPSLFMGPPAVVTKKVQQIHSKHEELTSDQFLQLKTGSLLNYQSVRYRTRQYYKPSAWKRIHAHGFETRLSTQGGKEILWRRLLKGRHTLTVFDQYLKQLPPISKRERKTLGIDHMSVPKKFYTHKDYKKNLRRQ